MDKRFSPSSLTLIAAICLFALSFVVRFMLSDFPKGIGVLPDEIRYLDLASSLFNQGELIQRGGYSSFQKILYPLSLFPAFLSDDPQQRMHVVTILNCLYLSSSVFPALLLARRIFKRALPIVLCLAFTVIMPDMAYSMTFLSECVYLPMVLWLVFVAIEALDAAGSKAMLLSGLAGLLCFLAYLAKEVALGFALAFVAIMVYRLVRAEGKTGKKGAALMGAVFLAAFVVPFVALKLTLFSGLLNSYDQASPDILLNPYAWLFALYALVSDATHFAIAFMFFPLVIPALTWRKLTRYEQELYVFCMLSFLFILLAVVYTISMREDLGHVGIRPHVRYVAPLFLPLLFLTIKQLRRRDGETLWRSPTVLGVALALTVLMGILSLGFLGTGDYSQGFDYAQFHVARLADEQFGDVPVDPQSGESFELDEDEIYQGDLFVINPAVWMLKLAFCLYLALGFWAYASRKRAWPGYVMLGVVAACMLANYLGACQYHASVYRVDESDVEEIAEIDAWVDRLPDGEQALIVYDEGSSHFNNLMDVYVDNDRLNCSYVGIDRFEAALKEGSSQKDLLLSCDATMGDNIFGVNGRTNDENAGFSFIIMSARTTAPAFDPSVVVDVTPETFVNARVYEVLTDGDIRVLALSEHSSSRR